ncbi:MAG: GNAT family N-acetyltransferase [Alphaproteobacteria bacterium]|nr:GNAT family N-acetyltransferase [Alphaproteobacteria bacterium]
MLAAFRFDGDRDHYERCFERHENGEISIIIATVDGHYAGFCMFNRQPKYSLFKKVGLPEIQDLNVLSSFRRQGIGQALVMFCEDLARRESYEEVGIGVGLDSSYGSAQRLYARMGYIPDGTGVSYDRKPVERGALRPIDDHLCLMMTKVL